MSLLMQLINAEANVDIVFVFFTAPDFVVVANLIVAAVAALVDLDVDSVVIASC